MNSSINRETIYEASNLTFNGNNYVDTGICLFSSENIDKDFEITINMNGTPTSVATFLSDMEEVIPYPGVCVRYKSNDVTIIEVAFSKDIPRFSFPVSSVHNHDLHIKRIGTEASAWIDDDISTVQISAFSTVTTNIPLTLGASLDGSQIPWRYFTGTINHIKIEWITVRKTTRWEDYLNTLKTDFTKVTRLDFLQPDGSVAFSLDNDPYRKKNRAFIQDGSLTVNLQNGQRRSATVRLSNLDGEYDYNVNRVWFGTQVRLLMGLVLPDGTDYLIPQGVFYVKDPTEEMLPNQRTATYNLVDKWCMLDGTLAGQLEGIYECPVNSSIFSAIDGILQIDMGNGQKIDSTPATYTSWYNGKTQTLPDGTTAALTNSPYTARYDSEGDTYASVILGLNEMLAGWIGYDAMGSLHLEASQDDILDINKPILWTFTPTEKQFLGATYTLNNSEVKNDVIRVGESISGYSQVGGRAQNFDPASDTNINLIGLRTDRKSKAGYYTDDVCMALAEFDLKRNTVLNKSVTIRSSQMFHLQENNLIAVKRPDKQGEPIERHLLTGYTLPVASTGEMTLNCTSVQDFPVATVMSLSDFNQNLS